MFNGYAGIEVDAGAEGIDNRAYDNAGTASSTPPATTLPN